MGRPAKVDELEGMARSGRLWAIIDACDEPDVLAKMYELGEERALCLYRGEAESEFAEIAPFIVHVDDFLLRWIQDNLWDKPWGVFVVAGGDLESLRTHFRKFLIVKDPEGERMYFRYYDPRILEAFFPACNDDELGQFFAKVEGFGISRKDQPEVTLLSWRPR